MEEVKVRHLLTYLEQWAPFSYQESYDNSGLITGDPEQNITGILVSLDCTESVVDEAVTKRCNVIVAHHPILFRAIKSLTGKNYVERTILAAIRNHVALVAIHTNLDNIHTGVNRRIGEKLGLEKMTILAPARGKLTKLVTFVPESHQGVVQNALFSAGAGTVGNYDQCSFRISGTGQFRPTDQAKPWQGTKGQLEETPETRLEVLLPKHREGSVLRALRQSHPYEEVAYYLTDLTNENQEVGAGMVGTLREPVETLEFIKSLKIKLQTPMVRHTKLVYPSVSRVAVCGGSGSFLLGAAIQADAQIFISADFKYHEFFDADGRIVIADIGHFESEQFTKDLLTEVLAKKFTTFAILFSETATNPISYL